MIDAKKAVSFDWLLFVVTLALVGLGLVMISSATASMLKAGIALRDQPLARQIVFAGLGFAIMAVASIVNYRLWVSLRWVLYVAVIGLLAALEVVGSVLFGAQSWFDLDLIGLQPSELAKIVLIILLARYFADHEEQVRRGTGLIVSLAMAAPIFALVAIQPDMGTMAVLVAIWLGMLFTAGLRPQHIVILALVAIVLAPLVWGVLPSHARDRVTMFVDPSSASGDQTFAIDQALIGVGSGGLWGKGLGQGTQSQLSFLRVRHTDYIFAVLAEELGFAGSLMLIALYVALLMRIMRIGARAGDVCGRLIATGVAVMIFVQVFINLGFHVRLLPVTGLPLPMMSYGGSSLITVLIGLGLVESVALYHTPREALA